MASDSSGWFFGWFDDDTSTSDGSSDEGSDFLSGNFLDTMFSWVDVVTEHFVEDVYRGLVTDNWALILTLVSLYFVIYGWMIWMRLVEVSADEFLRHGGKIAFIVMLLLSYPFFEQAISRVFINGPDELTSGIMSAVRLDVFDSSDVKTGIQLFFDKAIGLVVIVFDVDGILSKIWAVVIGAAVVWMMYKSIGMLIMARLFTAALLALAPIFFVAYLYKPTRGVFYAWLQTLIGMFLLPLFVYTVLALNLAILQYPILQMESNIAGGDFSISRISSFAVMVLAMAYVFGNIQGVASSVAGGFVMQQYSVARDGAGTVKDRLNNYKKNYQEKKAAKEEEA